MSDWKVPLADVRISESEIAAVADTYRSGWLSLGPQTERFEQEFGAYVGCRHAIAAANGTAALHLLLAGFNVGQADEVIVPSMTFVATVNAIAYTGAKPVFCDIRDLTQPWIGAEEVGALISPRTRAILAMAYGGHPGDILRLRKIAAENGVLLLLDAAHAIGSWIDERSLAGLCDGAAYSFFSNKNLAVGEGGMVVTDSDQAAERIRLLRSHGMTTLTWDRHRGHASAYDVVELGYNYRIDEPRATLGRLRLNRLESENRARAAIVAHYRNRLNDQRVLLTAAPAEGTTPAHHLFTICLPDRASREPFRSSLAAAGVQTSVHYPPAHKFAIYTSEQIELPITDSYAERTVTLPLFPHMTEEQVELVLDTVATALAQTGAGSRAA